MESDDEFDLLPVKRRGPSVNTVLSPKTNNLITPLDNEGDFMKLPVDYGTNGLGLSEDSLLGGNKRSPLVDNGLSSINNSDEIQKFKIYGDGLVTDASFAKYRETRIQSEDPFDNISMKVSGSGSPCLSDAYREHESNKENVNDVVHNEILYNTLINGFDSMGLDKVTTETVNVGAVDPFEYLASDEPSLRKSKEVRFDIQKINRVTAATTTQDFPVVNVQFESKDDFDDFQPVEHSDFIDGLDFLEQCGGNETGAMEELARKSLYVKFDPLCDSHKTKDIVSVETISEEHVNLDLNTMIDIFPSSLLPNIQERDVLPSSSIDPFSPVKEQKSSNVDIFTSSLLPNVQERDADVLPSSSVDPFSPVKEQKSSSVDLYEIYPAQKPDLNNMTDTGLVEPLLYTQSDIEEVVKRVKVDLEDDINARELDWKKKYEELESKIKEEVAMRELIEQDYQGKIDSLRKENVDMKQVLAQYEGTIVELTENSHHDNKSNEETLAEAIRAREQSQEDINSAEQNLFDAYKRIEKLKQTIETCKGNENTLKENNSTLHTKLNASEDRYTKLRDHASEKIDAANALISKVRKQQEVDLAGLNAALQKAQNRVNNLELEIQQKNVENQQLSQICDDLIKKVSG